VPFEKQRKKSKEKTCLLVNLSSFEMFLGLPNLNDRHDKLYFMQKSTSRKYIKIEKKVAKAKICCKKLENNGKISVHKKA